MSSRVVVTGIGALTCVGHGRQGLWEGILREKSGIGLITRFDASNYDAKCAGEINDFNPADYFPPHKLKRIDRFAQFALVLSQQALDDAGLKLSPEHPRTDVGVSFGTALGGITTAELTHERFVREGNRAIPAALALQVFGGSAHSNIAIAYGVRGYSTTNSNSCASGTVAVGEAFRVIREGRVQVMIVRAASNFFGKKPPAISGTKAYYGHPLGASGAIEAAICCLAMEHSHIPPTLNCHEPCDEITPGFDLVRLKGRSQPLKYVLSNSFGFGGINASLVFGKVE